MGFRESYPSLPKGRSFTRSLSIGTLDSFWSLVPDQTLGYQNQYPGRSRTRTKGISILGEVPFDENLKKGIKDSRGITAESTRVLRSSLSFLLKKETSNVITVTSTTKGEGKSFVSYNLAASYKALGKKVILVGADLRNPQLHNRMGIERENQGLSTYLADENFNDLDALIKKGADTAEMDYLLSGAFRPTHRSCSCALE